MSEWMKPKPFKALAVRAAREDVIEGIFLYEKGKIDLDSVIKLVDEHEKAVIFNARAQMSKIRRGDGKKRRTRR